MDASFVTPLMVGFLMVLFRTTALLSTAPLFGMKSVPARLRMGLSLVTAYTAFAGAGFPSFRAGLAMGPILAGIVGETVVGLATGLAARFAVDAAAGAGSLIAGSVGLSFGATVDPEHGTESTAVSEVLSLGTLGVMVALGIHRDVIAWLCRSVVDLPPGSTVSIEPLAGAVVAQGIHAVGLAVRLAFPVLAAVTFGHVALGVVGRTAPQLNISSVGFSITILAGGGALFLIAPSITEIAARAAQTALAGGR